MLHILYKIYLNICRYKIAFKKPDSLSKLGHTQLYTKNVVMVLLFCKGNKMQ